MEPDIKNNALYKIESLLPSKDAVDAVVRQSVDNLPSVPVVIVKLLRLTNDDKVSLSQIETIVETEPAIMVRVLRIVNSAAYGLSRRVSSVRSALLHLGLSKLRSLALDVTMYEHFIRRRKGAELDKIFFWQHCLSVACLSKALAYELGHPDPEEVYSCGLLHDLGKIILESYGRISYSEFIRNVSSGSGILIEDERKLLGMGHDDIGAFFANTWSFPDTTTLSIKYHHSRFRHIPLSDRDYLAIAIVAFSNLIAWTQGLGSVDIIRQPVLQPEIEEFVVIEKLDINRILHKMDSEVKNISQFYNFTFPSADKFRENLLRANINLGKVNTKLYYSNEAAFPSDKQPHITQISKTLTNFNYRLDDKEIIGKTLKAIHDDLHYDRLYVMEIEYSSRNLVIKHVMDSTNLNEKILLRKIRVTPYMEGFIRCLRSKTPVIIKGSTMEELDVLVSLRIKELGIVPITSSNQVIGVLALDNISVRTPLSDKDLSSLLVIASELGIALEHARLFKKYKLMASIDGLTRVYNRVTIEEILQNNFSQAKSENLPLSVCMIDIDHFKKFNDNFGHQAGDSVLRIVSAAMKKLSRPNDSIGRYGGEEFIAVINNTDFKNTLLLAQRLRLEIEKIGNLLVKRFKDHYLTVSIGAAAVEDTMTSKEELIAKADGALYYAKASGRNRVVGFYGDEKICV
ncbi:diguanylate cyclase (GGDEF) domain/uncharacterized domain HDIG-containing [Candidatus Magnetoovum chiemensis]|nr:diguanylate cyclase (GGDEF) domain/uncharacterized domain HDIG-containing [Candidatus Magnetoovum chiemensis]